MTISRWMLLSCFAAGLLIGCGSDPQIIEPPQESALADQSTPENTIKRFVQLYEREDEVEYEKLFTGDFLFEFSPSTDPELAYWYRAGWWQGDEMMAAKNLFHGGVNREGVWQAGAKTVDLKLILTAPRDDNGEGRDPLAYKVLFTPVLMSVQLPPTPEDLQGTTFIVGGADPAVHRIFLVRGDHASVLREDQPADDKHWYIWLWRDESTVTRKVTVLQSDGGDLPVQTRPTSWGRIKGLYR